MVFSTFAMLDQGGLASHLDERLSGSFARSWLKRPFGRRAKQRVLIYREPGEISLSQILPYFHHATAFFDRYGTEFRCRPVAEFLAAEPSLDADIVMIQPWFTVNGENLARSFEILRARLPAARFVFLDSFAHNDLRLARFVDPHVDLYFKKSIFRDRREYLRPWRGDTNLTEYYGDLYGLDQGAPVDWHVPSTILPKLRLSPNFFTHDRFVRAFATGTLRPFGARRIDVHSRLGEVGSPWYSAMRKDAKAKIEAIQGCTLSSPGRLGLAAFMAELANSKLCFSPFGYGELCWRDIEAFQTGAVLVKPTMDHLETLPDLYEPGVTYLPVRWDFSDLETVVRGALADPPKMEAIAREAWNRVARFLCEGRFLADTAPMLFDDRGFGNPAAG